MPENFTQELIWRANYNDETSLLEKDSNGHEHLFKEIDQSKLVSFDILKLPTSIDAFERETTSMIITNLQGEKVKATFTTYNANFKPLLRVMINNTKQLIFTRRRTKSTGGKVAIFGDDPNKYASNEEIPRCKSCRQYTSLKNIPYPMEFPNKVTILVGWQENINGKNRQAINYIFPDGSMELAGEWGSDSVHKEARPYIQPKKEE